VKSVHEIAQEVFDTYGVRVITDQERSGLPIACRPADERTCLTYLQQVLTRELSIYSPQVIRKSKLNEIILCQKLASEGQRRGGLTCAAFLGSLGLPFIRNKIYLNIKVGGGWQYMRAAFHHELFHMIDYFDDINGYYDQRWKSLNRPGFVYHKDRIDEQRAKPQRGFISEYAMDAVIEDKAEVYSYLLIDHRGTEKLVREDRILARKVVRMKELLHSFSSEFNEDFWSKRDAASISYAKSIVKKRS